MLDTSHAAKTTATHLAWDVLIRMSSVSLLILLALAYLTGEETQHTHRIIGYAFGALIGITIYWELVRPHHARSPQTVLSASFVVRLLRGPHAPSPAPGHVPASAAVMALAVVLGVLGSTALLLMVVTHAIWRSVSVDEMHEVIAYFALGLVIFHSAVVLIASAEHLERRLQKIVGG